MEPHWASSGEEEVAGGWLDAARFAAMCRAVGLGREGFEVGSIGRERGRERREDGAALDSTERALWLCK